MEEELKEAADKNIIRGKTSTSTQDITSSISLKSEDN